MHQMKLNDILTNCITVNYFFSFLSNAFSDLGSVGRKKKKKTQK